MYRRTNGRTRKLILGVAVAALAGGALAVGTGLSSAGENCAGLDTALGNNLSFIADQRANPDALSDARIANRQAVVDLINQRRATAGCTGAVEAAPAAPPAEEPAPEQNGDGDGEVVCKGSTVTLSGEAGAPFASSGTFPIGTTLKVTNLDNDKSITVRVQTTSGSCVLLNDAAFEQVREPGKFLIRRAVIERVG
ncbi:septal ring lytic transglycosylase RlpA family protein [Jidongwangia harbinensis]|uniref:septal ring lytic transglycosylase RlpA family protein n=1 Tax=Jidongwangia harbinensis TaxID=2878561 RepID=UPI001CD9E59A|nr:septal ring lytic transglycosylase RlpA family protein [Jidongwangia harbinensis]MCA2212641.1 septal ring lytic transglycosylase RlpA family protein [Jidongwangia harbinensis]